MTFNYTIAHYTFSRDWVVFPHNWRSNKFKLLSLTHKFEFETCLLIIISFLYFFVFYQDNNSSITSTSAFNWDNNSDALDVTSILTNPTTTTSLDTVESFISTTMGYETKDMSLPTPTHDDSSNMNYTNLNIITNDHTHTTLLILISFVIIAVICNSFMCIVIKLDQRLHHMIYYFCSSMSLLHILIATTVMPLSAAVFVAGETNWHGLILINNEHYPS